MVRGWNACPDAGGALFCDVLPTQGCSRSRNKFASCLILMLGLVCLAAVEEIKHCLPPLPRCLIPRVLRTFLANLASKCSNLVPPGLPI
jgi:hypothetical protein